MKAKKTGRGVRWCAVALAAALVLAGTGPIGAATVGVVNINTASAAELELLPGVGARRAAAIVATRQKRGGFMRADELMEVEGIGAVMLEQMRSHVTLSGSTNARRVAPPPATAGPVR